MTTFEIDVIVLLSTILALACFPAIAAIRFLRLAKPLRKFMRDGLRAFQIPAELIELVKAHLEQLTSLAQGAVMAHDMVEAEKKRRAGILQMPPPVGTGTLDQAVRAPTADEIKQAMPLPELFGEGGPAVVVEGRVDMGTNGVPRTIDQGAVSANDGTAA